MSKPRKKQQGTPHTTSSNAVDWERRARDLYRRGILELVHLDSRPDGAVRAHDAHTGESDQSAPGIPAGRLISDQMPEAH